MSGAARAGPEAHVGAGGAGAHAARRARGRGGGAGAGRAGGPRAAHEEAARLLDAQAPQQERGAAAQAAAEPHQPSWSVMALLTFCFI